MVAVAASGEDGRVQPLQVWKVELEKGLAAHDVRGTLHLTDRTLVFTPHGETVEVPIDLTAIIRVKRLRLSAVLLLGWTDADRIRETAYYLAKPPPLHQTMKDETETAVGLGRIARPGKRTQQRRNSTYLAETGQLNRSMLKAWVAEIERRRSAARGG